MPTILVAPSGFKECLDATEVASFIETGIRRVDASAVVRQLPLIDGGEGFCVGLTTGAGGHFTWHEVSGPVGDPVTAPIGWLPDGRTAVVEMASAAGLRLVPRDHRQPGRTTTYGVGQLVVAALDGGATRILVGCGDSGTNDGGAGLAAALGARLLDADGRSLRPGGDRLAELARIDVSTLDPRLVRCEVIVACNTSNVLCGRRGVARVYGPQKGATPAGVERLAAGLEHWAAVIRRDLGIDVARLPGAGASGGLGAGLVAFCGATLRPRLDVVAQWLDLDRALRGVDLVVTAEGSLDHQSAHGKVPTEIARRAASAGIPVIAIAGTLGRGARRNLEPGNGIDAYTGILRAPCSLSEAFERAGEWIADAAEQSMRLLNVGARLTRC